MKWNSVEKKATDKMIKKVQDVLKVTFPEDFVKAIKEYNGGSPEWNCIIVNGVEEGVNNLFSFCEDDPEYILDSLETEFLDENDNLRLLKDTNLVPFADDRGGNLFCYDFTEKEPKIVFWDLEMCEACFVCNTFTEFVNMLYEYKDEDEN